MTTAAPAQVIRPQKGQQEKFLSSKADIVIYGGAAGGGKTWGLLFEGLRYILPTKHRPHGVKGFSGVIFRRTTPQIRAEGGLWDESLKLYPEFDGDPRETILEWRFPKSAGQTMRFAGLQHASDVKNWQGSQIPYIGFDELTHFTEDQFFYLVSRNRSNCGIKPYIRATCNPDPDSWVADFIAWWIEQDENSPNWGLPIKERDGVLRYFVRSSGVITWGDTREELIPLLPEEMQEQIRLGNITPDALIRSVTFIKSTVYDNKILLQNNPEYLGNLLSLSYVEREKLLSGNWKVQPTAGNIFNTDWWAGKIVPAAPAGLITLRYWDKAATDEKENPKAAYTAGVKIARTKEGIYYILDVVEGQWSSNRREKIMQQTAIDDGEHVRIFVEQEPGSGGKESAEFTIRGLSGYYIKAEKVTGSKIARAMPASAQVEAGNVYMVKAPWNRRFIQQGAAFPQGRLKDIIDAFCGGFNKLYKMKRHDINTWPTSSR